MAVWPLDRQSDEGQLLDSLSAESRALAMRIQNPARRKEWAATRVLSRYLSGYEPVSGPVGHPGWPGDLRGSISHKDGHVALWLAASPTMACGVDLERCRDLSDGVISRIMNERERALCAAWREDSVSSLVFAVKEAVYKALFPYVGRVFYFEAVEVLDICLAGSSAVLELQVTDTLAPGVPAGKRIRASARIIRLGCEDYWLALAQTPVFGRAEIC